MGTSTVETTQEMGSFSQDKFGFWNYRCGSVGTKKDAENACANLNGRAAFFRSGNLPVPIHPNDDAEQLLERCRSWHHNLECYKGGGAMLRLTTERRFFFLYNSGLNTSYPAIIF